MWPAQVRAIVNLEESIRNGRPRALIQMATGAGKTFTAISALYRLINEGGARRVLFLVDRGNLGRQAHKEFQAFTTPDDGRKSIHAAAAVALFLIETWQREFPTRPLPKAGVSEDGQRR
jgi:type I site-specific restriction endonuclease